jgi:hypothetical protein
VNRVTAVTGPTRVPQRFRQACRWGVLVAGAYLLAGVSVGVVAAGLAGWHLWRPPRPAVLLVAAITALAVVPVVWIAGNGDRLGAASAQLVTGNPWPGRLAAVGLLLLVVGVARDVAADAGSPDPVHTDAAPVGGTA